MVKNNVTNRTYEYKTVWTIADIDIFKCKLGGYSHKLLLCSVKHSMKNVNFINAEMHFFTQFTPRFALGLWSIIGNISSRLCI